MAIIIPSYSFDEISCHFGGWQAYPGLS